VKTARGVSIPSRRTFQIILGSIWLLDGLLQLKPQMFTSAFIQQVILPNTQNQPAWIAASIEWAGRIAALHIVVWNALFAAIQIILGLALIFDLWSRGALAASFLWSAIVWWVGEGFGGLATGSALVPTGAPGAIVFYVLAGIALWPARDNAPSMRESGRTFARWSLIVLWLVGAALQLQPAFLKPHGLDQSFPAGWLARLVGGHSLAVTIFLSVIQLAAGLAFLGKRLVRPAAWATIALSLLFWWVGQDFGEMLSPLGTDPDAGPLWVLLAFCAVPGLLSRRSQ
jgi:hypothetical protein